jgi:hypothetical protein
MPQLSLIPAEALHLEHVNSASLHTWMSAVLLSATAQRFVKHNAMIDDFVVHDTCMKHQLLHLECNCQLFNHSC